MRVATNLRVLVKGGGDLASGAIIRMTRAGWTVLVTELAQPMAVRRTVSFAQAVFGGETVVEEVAALKVENQIEAELAWSQKKIAVIIDPECASWCWFQPHVVVDARMTKHANLQHIEDQPFIIGLGPGFDAPHNCHAVIETKRGPHLGRVVWKGCALEDTGIADMVQGFQGERVLRAPVSGVVKAFVEIGDTLKQGDLIADVGGVGVPAPFDGLLRGLIHPGLYVSQGIKIGDLDPRDDPCLCRLVSDKALAVGGGVIEAILSYPRVREQMCHD